MYTSIKTMVNRKYEQEKTNAKALVQTVEAVCLTADIWPSIIMDAYMVVTCHYVDDSEKLATVLLRDLPFLVTPWCNKSLL